MSLKNLIMFLLTLIIIVLAISLLVFLASAALYGALILPVLFVGSMLIFYFGVSFLTKDH